jgi:hypothetical protein
MTHIGMNPMRHACERHAVQGTVSTYELGAAHLFVRHIAEVKGAAILGPRAQPVAVWTGRELQQQRHEPMHGGVAGHKPKDPPSHRPALLQRHRPAFLAMVLT